MSIEREVAERVHLHIELHNRFAQGDASGVNALISDDYEGWLYRPQTGIMQRFSAEEMREGNRQAAQYYAGKAIHFQVAGVTVVPQGQDQAAASYQVIFREGERMVRALALEVWRRESDGEWRLIRWSEEKGAANR